MRSVHWAAQPETPLCGFMHRASSHHGLARTRRHRLRSDQEVNLYAQEAAATRLPYFSWYTPLFKAMRARMGGRFDDATTLR